MCSLIGWSGYYNKNLLEKVFFYSKIRGLHAFGYSFYKNGILKTKKYLKYYDFIDSINFDAPNKFIAHFRYSTSGDWKILDNNQPLTIDNLSIAFNGVISQNTKESMENEFKCKLPYDNDGFVLMQKYNDFNFINSNITFAMIGLKNNQLFALKNNKRPLWIYEKQNIKLITSTNDIMQRSGINDAKKIHDLKLWTE